MTTSNQTLAVAYAPPPQTAAWPVADTANSKAKVIGYPVSPGLGTPVVATWQLNRALTGVAVSKLLTLPSNPLTAALPTAQSGFALYRQCPLASIARNILANGGFLSGAHAWTLQNSTATGTIIVDATSVTGYAARVVKPSTGFPYYQETFMVEPGKAYSFACQLRTDGTINAYLEIGWLDAAGTQISAADSAVGAPTSWTERVITNATAPANANRVMVRLVLDNNVTSGIALFTAVRAFQQAAVAPAWVTAHQQYVQRGLWSSSTTLASLLTNPDIETAVSSSVDGFNDPLANLSEWVLLAGNTFTVASNLVSNAAGNTNRMGAGHPDWWDSPSGSRIRFKWVTGGAFYIFVRYTDASNYVYYSADGATMKLWKVVANVATQIGSTQTAVLTTGNFYWIQWQISGTSFGSTTLDNDTAGAPGTNVATITAQTISDAAVAYGTIAVQMDGGTGMQFGGNFASVVRVKIPAVTGWTPTQVAGLSAFAVSKVLPYAGVYSLSIIQRNASDDAHWINAYTSVTSTLRSVCGRAKVANGGGTGAYVQVVGAATNATNAITGTVDWTVINRSAVTDTLATGYRCRMTGIGTAWFDNLWLVAEAYDTVNFEPSGSSSAVMPRLASSCALPDPGLSPSDFAFVVVVRPEGAYNIGGSDRFILTLYQTPSGGGSDFTLRFDGAANSIRATKTRAGVLTTATDGAATAFAAGDTLVIGVRYNTTEGLFLYVSKNGGAVATYSNTTQEALLPLTSFTGIYYGMSVFNTNQADSTLAALSFLKAGLTAAQLTAVVQNPYADPTDNVLALWGSEGTLYQVPVFDDRCLKLGTAYDWSVDSSSSGASAGTAFGLVTTTTVAALIDSWWLRSVEDSTKDMKIPVVEQFAYDVPKETYVSTPLVGGAKIIISAPAAYGEEIGLKLLYTSLADQNVKEAALRVLLSAPDTLYLQDQFGGLRKVAFTQSDHFVKHETFLEGQLNLIEAR